MDAKPKDSSIYTILFKIFVIIIIIFNQNDKYDHFLYTFDIEISNLQFDTFLISFYPV